MNLTRLVYDKLTHMGDRCLINSTWVTTILNWVYASRNENIPISSIGGNWSVTWEGISDELAFGMSAKFFPSSGSSPAASFAFCSA